MAQKSGNRRKVRLISSVEFKKGIQLYQNSLPHSPTCKGLSRGNCKFEIAFYELLYKERSFVLFKVLRREYASVFFCQIGHGYLPWSEIL